MTARARPHPDGPADAARPAVVAADAPDAVERAAAVLAAGRLVALPTETVYGLAADATDGAAVARLYAAKGRPAQNPLIAHVADLAMAGRLGRLDGRARALAEAFWPGPLTLVVPLAAPSPLAPAVTAGNPTVALRVPASTAFRAVIHRLGRPVAAPSANRSGRITATRAADVVAELGARVDLVLDAGPSPVGIESTIVGLGAGPARLLRPGGLDAEAIEAVLGAPLERPAPAGDGPLAAPGMMASHYAPRAAVRLDVPAGAVRPGEARLAFGGGESAGAAPFFDLSPSGDLAEAARNLYHGLRRLDRPDVPCIAVAPVPATGLGLAIRDRLARAAAPRPADAARAGHRDRHDRKDGIP